MSRRRYVRTTAATCVAAACALIVGVPTGGADASDKASCLGIESSNVAPPGSSDEFPGGRAEAQTFVFELADQLGVPPGALASSFAKVHAGSHEACDEAGGG